MAQEILDSFRLYAESYPVDFQYRLLRGSDETFEGLIPNYGLNNMLRVHYSEDKQFDGDEDDKFFWCSIWPSYSFPTNSNFSCSRWGSYIDRPISSISILQTELTVDLVMVRT